MNRVTSAAMITLAVFVAACVTINVYFPEAAAIEAADRIIDKVRGEDSKAPSGDTQSRVGEQPVPLALAYRLSSFLVSDARAQDRIDFDRPSPEKTALEDSLARRFPELKPYYDSGAIGLTDAGLIDFRDRGLVPLSERNRVVQLVAAQNSDWNALYAEIARLNGRPEWQDDIRRTFAERWIAKADRGWWYREDGQWKRK